MIGIGLPLYYNSLVFLLILTAAWFRIEAEKVEILFCLQEKSDAQLCSLEILNGCFLSGTGTFHWNFVDSFQLKLSYIYIYGHTSLCQTARHGLAYVITLPIRIPNPRSCCFSLRTWLSTRVLNLYSTTRASLPTWSRWEMRWAGAWFIEWS